AAEPDPGRLDGRLVRVEGDLLTGAADLGDVGRVVDGVVGVVAGDHDHDRWHRDGHGYELRLRLRPRLDAAVRNGRRRRGRRRASGLGLRLVLVLGRADGGERAT